MMPPGPVPRMRVRSMPRSLASLRTCGLAQTPPCWLTVAGGLTVAGALCVAANVGAADDGAAAGAEACAGGVVGAVWAAAADSVGAAAGVEAGAAGVGAATRRRGRGRVDLVPYPTSTPPLPPSP